MDNSQPIARWSFFWYDGRRNPTPTTLAQLETDIRFRTNLSSTDLAAADVDPVINKYYKDLVTVATSANDDLFYEMSTAATVVNQREYALPSDFLRFKKLEVTYDGIQWRVVEELDLTQLNISVNATTGTTTDSNFSIQLPYYDLEENSLFLYPMPASTTGGAQSPGLRLHYIKRAADLSASGDIPVLPNEYHRLISLGATADVFLRYGKTAEYQLAQAEYERGKAGMAAALGKRNIDTAFSMQVAREDYT